MTIRHISSKDNLAKESSVPVQSPDAGTPVWPKAFFCTEHGKLLQDPVLGPTGESFERSAILEGDARKNKLQPSEYYPNRALKVIIEDTVALHNDSLRAGIRCIQQSLSHGLSHLLPEAAAKEKIFRPLNDAFYCPITFNPMHEPVTCPEGYTFEKAAIENWVRVNGNSPITRTPLTVSKLYPNNAIRALLDEEKQKPEELMHPCIRKWKNEPNPKVTDIERGEASDDLNTTNTGNSRNPTETNETNGDEQPHRKVVLAMLTLLAIACSLLFVVHRQLLFCALFSILLIVALVSKQPNRP